MKVIGLTGGIASGKSAVAAMLRELGAQVLDADAIYHGLIEPVEGCPSELATAIAQRFPEVLQDDGHIDRKRLGGRVFASAPEREALNAMTHPAVAAAVGARVDELAASGVTEVVYDVPLLFERGLERGMHGVIVVWVPQSIQLARLCARDGIAQAEALTRLAAQWPLDDKRKRATWVVDNSGTLAKTEEQVRAVWSACRTSA